MAHISYPFKKLNKTVYKKPASILTDDSIYWKKLGSPVLVKEFGAIDYLDFSPVEPHYFAATCSVRIQVYDPITKTVVKNISKFLQGAYGGSYRADGKLLVAGSEEAAVKLFDVHSKTVLRVFNGHTGPVHRTFFTKDQVKVISVSDDKSVCLWDIATEQKLSSFFEHTDYVRTGAASTVSPDIILSGGYDHLLKLYDCRSNETILTVNHCSPVESCLFLPSGGLFISAGGTEIKVWDIFNGGKLLANISQHHKTVTSLRLASNGSRLMSASLDRHVKIYDVSTFKPIHNIDFPNAILSMAISDRDDVLAVGMVDGVISIRKREQLTQPSAQKKGLFKFAPDHVAVSVAINKVDAVVKNNKAETEPEVDKFLRKMQFSKALSAALKPIAIKSPEKTIALMQEMLRRKVLNSAMLGLNESRIGNLLTFFNKNLGETRFSRTVIDAVNVFVDVFHNQIKYFSERNLWLYEKLQKRLKEEIDVCKQISELEGAISLLLAGAEVHTTNVVDLTENLMPSARAQTEIVVGVE